MNARVDEPIVGRPLNIITSLTRDHAETNWRIDALTLSRMVPLEGNFTCEIDDKSLQSIVAEPKQYRIYVLVTRVVRQEGKMLYCEIRALQPEDIHIGANLNLTPMIIRLQFVSSDDDSMTLRVQPAISYLHTEENVPLGVPFEIRVKPESVAHIHDYAPFCDREGETYYGGSPYMITIEADSLKQMAPEFQEYNDNRLTSFILPKSQEERTAIRELFDLKY